LLLFFTFLNSKIAVLINLKLNDNQIFILPVFSFHFTNFCEVSLRPSACLLTSNLIDDLDQLNWYFTPFSPTCIPKYHNPSHNRFMQRKLSNPNTQTFAVDAHLPNWYHCSNVQKNIFLWVEGVYIHLFILKSHDRIIIFTFFF